MASFAASCVLVASATWWSGCTDAASGGDNGGDNSADAGTWEGDASGTLTPDGGRSDTGALPTVQPLGVNAGDIVPTPDGGLLVVFGDRGKLNVSPGMPWQQEIDLGRYTLAAAKYDAQGNLEWLRALATPTATTANAKLASVRLAVADDGAIGFVMSGWGEWVFGTGATARTFDLPARPQTTRNSLVTGCFEPTGELRWAVPWSNGAAGATSHGHLDSRSIASVGDVFIVAALSKLNDLDQCPAFECFQPNSVYRGDPETLIWQGAAMKGAHHLLLALEQKTGALRWFSLPGSIEVHGDYHATEGHSDARIVAAGPQTAAVIVTLHASKSTTESVGKTGPTATIGGGYHVLVGTVDASDGATRWVRVIRPQLDISSGGAELNYVDVAASPAGDVHVYGYAPTLLDGGPEVVSFGDGVTLSHPGLWNYLAQYDPAGIPRAHGMERKNSYLGRAATFGTGGLALVGSSIGVDSYGFDTPTPAKTSEARGGLWATVGADGRFELASFGNEYATGEVVARLSDGRLAVMFRVNDNGPGVPITFGSATAPSTVNIGNRYLGFVGADGKLP